MIFLSPLLSAFALTAANFPTVSAMCTGFRIKCEVVGANDPVACAQYHMDNCYFDELSGCHGNPDPCETFETAEACQVHRDCSWSGSPGKVDPPAQDNISAVFTGTATATLQYYALDIYTNQKVFDKEAILEYPVSVTFDDPLTVAGGIDEANPFYLGIVPLADITGDGSDEGYISMGSAFAMKTPETGRDLVLQSWQLNAENSGRFTGTLTDTQSIVGLEYFNAIMAYVDFGAGLFMTMPHPMSIGTTLEGEFSSKDAQIDLAGQSSDTYLTFTIKIYATASGEIVMPLSEPDSSEDTSTAFPHNTHPLFFVVLFLVCFLHL